MSCRAFCLLLALLPLVGCSRDDRPELRFEGEGAYHRLALAPTAAAPGRDSTITERLVAPAGQLAPWRAAAAQTPTAIRWPGVPEEDVEPRDVVVLPGPGERRVGIPGNFDPQSFNQVAVTYLSQGKENLYVRLMKRGKPVAGSRTTVAEKAPVPNTVLFDIPQTRLIQEPFDEIVVHLESEKLPFAPDGQAAAVVSVDLIRRPLAAWLPPADEPELVKISQESRRAVGLGSASPLSTEVEVEAQSYLQFSYGHPAEVRFPNQTLELTVRLTGGGKEQVETFRLDEAFDKRPTWKEALVELELPAGKVRAEFSLKASNGKEAWCALGVPSVFKPAAAAPTVLLVTSDTHRADHLGAARLGIEVETPVLDALAGRGILFEDCFSSTNVTNPSHIALMTATHPRDTGVWNNDTALSDAAPTLAERFHEAGFVTFAALSAHHLDHNISGLGQGFDRMTAPRHADRPAEQTLDLLEEWLPDAEGRPLFVWLHLFDAHSPYGPPEPFDRKYYPKDKDPFSEEIELTIDERLIPKYMEGLRDIEYPVAQYRAEVDYLDHQLGRLFGRDRFQEATIAVTADHGESFGQHQIWWDHADLYPDSIHIPLILYWNGAPAGTRIETPVRQIDVPRTLLDLTGLGDVEFPGRSLLDVVEGEEAVEEPRYGLSFARHSASITYQGWHLMVHLHDHAIDHGGVYEPRRKHQTELYNLRDDPRCENDLVWKELARARRLRDLLIRWLQEAPEENWSAGRMTDAAGLAQLAGLGYTVGMEDEREGELFDPECDCENWCAKF